MLDDGTRHDEQMEAHVEMVAIAHIEPTSKPTNDARANEATRFVPRCAYR